MSGVKSILIHSWYTNMICPRFRPLNAFFGSNTGTKLKSMEDIPSPKGLPFIGTTLSLIMAGSAPKLHWYIDKRHKKLGPIFKEGVGPVSCVFVSDPEAMRSVLSLEGKYPDHVVPDAWEIYNTINNISRGISFMNGEEWLHFRRILNSLLLKGDQPWIDNCCKPAIESLLSKLTDFSKRDTCPNMEQLLYEWGMEVMVSALIGPFSYLKVKHQLQDRLKHLATTAQLVFETSSKLMLISSRFAAKFRIPRWRKFETAVKNALKSSADMVELLSAKYVTEEERLLEKLKGQMTPDEVTMIVTDLILASGDTTAFAMQWILYLVAKNPDVQKRLREELTICNKQNQNYTSNVFLKNTVKESLRLYPVAPFLTRILPKPVTIRGYDIPAGITFALSIFTTGRDENNFPNPLKFDPDRWIRNGIRSNITQSAALPFAPGSRSCIGKKLAENTLQQTLAEIIMNFSVHVENARDVDVVLRMVAVPSEQIQFKFKPL